MLKLSSGSNWEVGVSGGGFLRLFLAVNVVSSLPSAADAATEDIFVQDALGHK